MAAQIKLLLFGLPRKVDPSQVRTLLGPCGSAPFELHDLPGNNDMAFAVVNLGEGMALQVTAWNAAARLSSQSFQGHRLEAWVTRDPT